MSDPSSQAPRLVVTEADLAPAVSPAAAVPAARARRSRRRRRLLIGAITAVTTLVILAILSEWLLPPLAERRLRGHLAANASGVSVRIEARPAVKLLFDRADRVDIKVREMRSGRGSLADSLAGTARVGRLDVAVATLISHGLRIDDVTLQKRGRVLVARATVTRSSVDAVLPSGVEIEQRGRGRNTLAFTGTVRAFGHVARGTVLVRARGGALVLEPDAMLGRLASFRIFADARVQVDSIRSRRSGEAYVFTARGHLS